MSDKPSANLTTLANEALNLWQEHLANLAADPKAKAELAQIMEPSRRWFADWMEKAQTGSYGTAPFATAEARTRTAATDGAAPAAAAADDGALRFAQLALHVAELEKRVQKLESRKPRSARATSIPAAED